MRLNNIFSEIYPYIPFILLFLGVFLLHLFLPYENGDYLFYHDVSPANLGEAINFAVQRYFQWSSRTIIDFTLVYLTTLPPIIWQFLDSIFLTGLAVLIPGIFIKKI
ncbi:MAG: hypothetical protein LBD03_03710 [Methanobrevibacter sp.]|jgi:hypothetical protein|nr:hypothetical protein [Candidatus Methanovirga procula]